MAPPTEDQTEELIADLQARRRRRRRLRGLAVVLGAMVIVGAVVTGVVLATGAPNNEASGSTLSSLAGGATTETTDASATASTTAEKPVTTGLTATTTPTSAPTTASGQTTTTALPTTSTTNWLASKIIVIDPGHQARADTSLEPVGPGSSIKKAKVSSGTSSVFTGVPESQVTLEVGLKLRAALEAQGIQVIMTRTTQDVDIPNSARARMANEAHADLTVRLHANGGNSSAHGLFTLYPALIKGWTDDIYAASKRAATIAQRDLIAATGAADRGLQPRSDLTGFNWSDVPVFLVEMGYMSNRAEDKLLRSSEYQDKIVAGLVQAVIEFLRTEG